MHKKNSYITDVLASSFFKKNDKELEKKYIHAFMLRLGFCNNGDIETLESVGRKLGITRERVRQIEKQGIDFLSMPDNNYIFYKIRNILEYHKGLSLSDISNVLLKENLIYPDEVKYMRGIVYIVCRITQRKDVDIFLYNSSFKKVKQSTRNINNNATILDSDKNIKIIKKIHDKIRKLSDNLGFITQEDINNILKCYGMEVADKVLYFFRNIKNNSIIKSFKGKDNKDLFIFKISTGNSIIITLNKLSSAIGNNYINIDLLAFLIQRNRINNRSEKRTKVHHFDIVSYIKSSSLFDVKNNDVLIKKDLIKGKCRLFGELNLIDIDILSYVRKNNGETCKDLCCHLKEKGYSKPIITASVYREEMFIHHGKRGSYLCYDIVTYNKLGLFKVK